MCSFLAHDVVRNLKHQRDMRNSISALYYKMKIHPLLLPLVTMFLGVFEAKAACVQLLSAHIIINNDWLLD